MIPIKYYVYFGIVAVALGGGVYFLKDWHYKPLSDRDQIIADQKQTNKSQQDTIKQLGIKITVLIQENKVTGFEEYFKGLADANNTNIDHTKFIF